MSKVRIFLTSFCILILFQGLNAQAQEEDELKELQELQNQIRRDKFDLILPQVMREHNIDMWIHVMKEGITYPFIRDEGAGFYADLGSNSGVFIFTDRGGDRIERAVLGRRWIGRQEVGPDHKLVEESGAYDIIVEASDRREPPGGPETEYDHRFKGVGEFVAERDPKRIAVNYREKLGPAVVSPSNDGISYTYYTLLVKALGDKYAKRMVSSEYLMYDYLSRPVESELVMYKKIRKWIDENLERDFAKIVPGVTKRRNRVIQRGDLFQISGGAEGDYHLRSLGSSEGEVRYRPWKFGNFFELKVEYGYVLREGETELPPELKKLWSDAMKIRKVLEDNIKIGRTGRETFEILKRKLDEAGFIVNRIQRFDKDLDPEKTQVSLDLHGLGKGSFAPRIGSIGPDWHHDMKLQLYHHFVMEMFIYMPLPSRINEEDHLRLWFHDGAYVTELGVEYFSPPPTEIRLIR